MSDNEITVQIDYDTLQFTVNPEPNEHNKNGIKDLNDANRNLLKSLKGHLQGKNQDNIKEKLKNIAGIQLEVLQNWFKTPSENKLSDVNYKKKYDDACKYEGEGDEENSWANLIKSEYKKDEKIKENNEDQESQYKFSLWGGEQKSSRKHRYNITNY